MQNFSIRYCNSAEITNKNEVTQYCLGVANQANFPTDFDDCFSHIFGDDRYELSFVYNGAIIYGFAVFSNITVRNQPSVLYLNGMVIHPIFQGIGISKMIISDMLEKHTPKYLMARTHNPRMYELITSFAVDNKSYYPHSDRLTPPIVLGVADSHSSTKLADENLIVRNAYDDEKISQSTRNPAITQKIFNRLGERDAFVVIAKVS